jgi:hypothetical protein
LDRVHLTPEEVADLMAPTPVASQPWVRPIAVKAETITRFA